MSCRPVTSKVILFEWFCTDPELKCDREMHIDTVFFVSVFLMNKRLLTLSQTESAKRWTFQQYRGKCPRRSSFPYLETFLSETKECSELRIEFEPMIKIKQQGTAEHF